MNILSDKRFNSDQRLFFWRQSRDGDNINDGKTGEHHYPNMPPHGNASDPPRCLNGRGSIAFAAHPGQCAAARSRLRQWRADRRLFYRTGYRVTGVDSAQAMIARCRQRFPQQEWRKMDMRQLDLPAKFDGLLAGTASFIWRATISAACFLCSDGMPGRTPH